MGDEGPQPSSYLISDQTLAKRDATRKLQNAAVRMAKKRAESLSPERRSEIARNAVMARWEKAQKRRTLD